MNRKIDIFSERNVFIITLFLAAVVLVFLAPKAAVNVDEQLHYPHAKKVVNWYFTQGEDTSCLNTPVSNLKYYGQSVDNFSALVNRLFNVEDEYLSRHYLGALFFLLLLFFAAKIAYQLTGSFWVASLTIISMFVMPRLFGQAFGNLKDIPFATGYSASIYFIIRFVKELPKPKWTTVICLSTSIAFTSSVRIGGLILFLYLGLAIITYIFLKPFFLKQIVSTKLHFVRLLGQGLTIVIVGYFFALLFWPFALQNVILNPLESLSMMEHYKVSIRQIFEGNLIWSTELPWYYLPKWLAISTPVFILMGFFFYLMFLLKSAIAKSQKNIFFDLFVVFTLFFPLVYVIIIGSNLYSGVRQMLFVIPILAVISSVGIFRVFNSNWKIWIKFSTLSIFFILLLFPLKHQFKTFPAGYIYFNEISGGNKKAWSNYEYDYYFHGIKESSEYLIELVGNEEVIVASNCNLSNYFEDVPNVKFQYTRYLERSSADWDYGLFGVNYIHPFQLKNNLWQSSQIVKTFYHQGNPIAVLLKRSNKNDFIGILEIRNGNIEKGEELLKQAIISDTKNVWLFVHLAKVCFEKNEFAEFDGFLEKGFKIHPYYEPLYLLKAQKLFDDKKYNEALETIQSLIEINPRYNNAAPLFKAVKNKLKIDKI